MFSESGLSARYALSFLRRAFPVYRRMRWRRASALAYRFALAMFTSGSGKGDCRQVIRKSLRIRERSNSERRNRKMFLAVRGSISAAVMIPGRRPPRCTPYIGGISVAVKMFCDAFLRKIAGIGYPTARRNPLLRKYVGHAELQDLRGKTNNPRYEREGAGKKRMRPFAIGAEKPVRNLSDNLLPAANRASRDTRKNSFLSSCNSLVGKRVASLKLPHRLSVGEQRSAKR